eukprot:sb/3476723/
MHGGIKFHPFSHYITYQFFLFSAADSEVINAVGGETSEAAGVVTFSKPVSTSTPIVKSGRWRSRVKKMRTPRLLSESSESSAGALGENYDEVDNEVTITNQNNQVFVLLDISIF